MNEICFGVVPKSQDALVAGAGNDQQFTGERIDCNSLRVRVAAVDAR